MTNNDDVFKAIADPVRRIILNELYARDGQTQFDIGGCLMMKHGLQISRQGVAKHIAVLESASLINIESSGRYRLHYINLAPLRNIYDNWLKRFNIKGDA